MEPNVITEVVERLGGIVQTAAVAGTALETVVLAARKGKFTHATAVLRLAMALAPDDPTEQMRVARRLTGLPEP
jgi:hypothetical protein